MRLLPGWTDHVRGRTSSSQTSTERRRYRCRDVGQYLPLRDLHAYSHGDQARGHACGKNEMSAAPDTFSVPGGVTRREFLRRLQAMGGLLLVADGLQIAKA